MIRPLQFFQRQLNLNSRSHQTGVWSPLIVLVSFCPLILTACQTDASAVPTENLFLPPTLVDTPSPPPLPTATQQRITVTPSCTDNLTFIEDITIPDGTIVEAGAELDKRWLISNSGTCNWDQEYQLVLVSGPDLGAVDAQALFPARSDTETEIHIVFTAPLEAGSVRSAWQAVNPDGDFFGDPIYIEVNVE